MNNPPKITPRTTELLQSGAPILLPPHVVAAVHGPAQGRDPFKPEKVAIIGTAPSSRLLAPFNDPTWTIWGSSPGNMNALPRVDAWIEVHSNFMWPEYRSYGEPYVKWLNEVTFPVMACDRNLFPKSIPFPTEKLVAMFGTDFFTSTFAWMMAYAIMIGVKEMALYGVDMASKDEYIQQRPGGKFFIREARLKGIKVSAPPESDLMQPTPLYGVMDATPFGRKLGARRAEVTQRIAQATQQRDMANQQITYLSGALEDIDYMANIWGSLTSVPQHEGGAS